MHRFIPDRFVLMLLSVLVAAWVRPLHGIFADAAQSVIYAGIFALFFLHGLRLPRREVAHAAKAWRLQGAMLGFCFIAMPLAGWGIAALSAPGLPPALLAGIIYLAVLPSTVQSAISYSAIGGGNVAASVVGAALSNLAGIILTPLLVLVLLGSSALSSSGIALDSGVIIRIAVMLLLPFALGQFAQGWLGSWTARQKPMLAMFDRAVILLAVYIAFSGAVASGAMMRLDPHIWIGLVISLLTLLAFAFGGAIVLGSVLELPRADRISLIFAGAHKSIATGAPMAALLFGDAAGLIILPAILYHMAQLIVSAPVAVRLQKFAANMR